MADVMDSQMWRFTLAGLIKRHLGGDALHPFKMLGYPEVEIAQDGSLRWPTVTIRFQVGPA